MNTFLIKKFSSSIGKTKVSFIGLGNMGFSMATNMLKSGKHSVYGIDVSKKLQENFAQQENALKVNSFSEAIKDSDFIVTSLPKCSIVKDVVDEIIQSNPKKGSLFVDTSTISPTISKTNSENLLRAGVIPSDAPVSGGMNGAKNGTLTFMVGCEEKDYENIKELISSMGKNFFYCGGYGSGEVAKLCNNLVLGVTSAALCESMAIGKKIGMDMNNLCKILSVSTGGTGWALQVNSPVPGFVETSPSNKNYEGGFGLELIQKDMHLGVELAKQINCEIKICETANVYYTELKETAPKKDLGYLYDYLIKKNH